MTALRSGDTAPDFTQQSTHGKVRFHERAGNAWVVRFSHPAEIAQRFRKGLQALKPRWRVTSQPHK